MPHHCSVTGFVSGLVVLLIIWALGSNRWLAANDRHLFLKNELLTKGHIASDEYLHDYERPNPV